MDPQADPFTLARRGRDLRHVTGAVGTCKVQGKLPWVMQVYHTLGNAGL